MKKYIMVVMLFLSVFPTVVFAQSSNWSTSSSFNTRIDFRILSSPDWNKASKNPVFNNFRQFNLQLPSYQKSIPFSPNDNSPQLQLQLQSQTSVSFTPLTQLSLTSFSRTEWQNSLMRR